MPKSASSTRMDFTQASTGQIVWIVWILLDSELWDGDGLTSSEERLEPTVPESASSTRKDFTQTSEN